MNSVRLCKLAVLKEPEEKRKRNFPTPYSIFTQQVGIGRENYIVKIVSEENDKIFTVR